MPLPALPWLALAFSLNASQMLQAASVVLTPVADTTLIEAAADNALGGATFLNAGTTQNNTRNRGLIRFDPAALLPSDAVISSATLRLVVTRRPSDGYEPSVFGIYRVLQPWGEGSTTPVGNNGGLGGPAQTNDATWHERFAHNLQAWTQPGGAPGADFAANFSSSAFIESVGPPYYEFESSLDTVADVQFWLRHPEQNFGWMLVCQSEDLPFTARRFASREDVGSAPQLLLDFVVVPEPGVLALALAGALAAICRRFLAQPVPPEIGSALR